MQVVVLNDGETYTDIEWCVVLEVPDHLDGDDLDDYVKENHADGVLIKSLL
jgi:hypothetical protein